MKNFRLLTVVLLVFSLLALGDNSVSATSSSDDVEEGSVNTVIDWSTNNQTIDGFGASGAFHMANNLKNWSDTQSREYILDLLYSKDEGIGLSWVRNMVGDGGLKADGTTWGHEQDGPNPTILPSEGNWCWEQSCGFWDDQIWLMNEAKERGVANYMSSVWSPPAWMKTNNSVINGGYLKEENYQDFADYIAEYILGYKDRYGIEISAISAANEPNTVVGYSSSEWTGEQLLTFVKDYLIPTFKERNIGTRIIMPEQEEFSEELALPVLNDPAVSAEVPIIAVHDYHSDSAPLPTANEQEKKVWMTEMFPRQGQSRDVTMETGLEWAKYVHRYLTKTNASLVNYWWILNRNTDSNSGLIHLNLEDNESYTLSKRLFTFGNYSKFIRPGFIRINASPENSGGVNVSAFKEPSTGKLVVVAVNENDSSKEFNLNFENFSADSLTPYTTSKADNLVKGEKINAEDDSLNTSLPARSVVTFVGKTDRIDFDPDAEYQFVNKNTGKVLEVKKRQNKDGANIEETVNRGRKSQRWTVNSVNNGYYSITNIKSERSIEVDDKSVLNGANVQQSTYKEGAHQEWALESLGDGTFRIINRNSGKVLEVGDTSYRDNVQQGSYEGKAEQQWKLQEIK